MTKKVGTVCFFRVGHGDSTLVHLTTGEVVVVDCAKSCYSVEVPAIKYMRDNGLHDIHLLVLTHPDGDHWSGMLQLIEWVADVGGKIHNLVLYGGLTFAELRACLIKKAESLARHKSLARKADETVSALYGMSQRIGKLLQALSGVRDDVEKRGGVYRRDGPFGHLQSFGHGVHAFIVGPTALASRRWDEGQLNRFVDILLYGNQPTEPSMNDMSCIVWLWLGKSTVFLPGDASEKSCLRAIRLYQKNHEIFYGREPKADIIKASHHGCSSGSSVELWNTLTKNQGSCVVFSAGPRKSWEHPATKTLEHLRGCGHNVKIFCTNICPARLSDLKKRRRTFSAPSRLDRSSVATFVPMDRSTSCHGDCAFEVYEDGTIQAVPEENRGRCWYLNRGASDACFR